MEDNSTKGTPKRRRLAHQTPRIQLPCGLLIKTIQVWIPPIYSSRWPAPNNEFIDYQWYALKRASHVNSEWRSVIESFPILGVYNFHIVSQNIPLLLDSKLIVRNLIVEYIFNANLIQLTHRQIHPISEESTLLAVYGMVALEHLTLRNFHTPILTGMCSLQHLQSLSIDYPCSEIPRVNLELLTNLPLTALSLNGVQHIDFDHIKQIRTLTKLTIIQCASMENVSGLEELVGLRSLTIRQCPQFDQLSYVAKLSSLTFLEVNQCRNAYNWDLTPLSGLLNLTTLNINFFKNTSSILPLRTLTALVRLSMRDMVNLTDLSPLISLTHLRSLALGGCLRLSDTSPLAYIPSLRNLDLYKCSSITQLDFLSTQDQQNPRLNKYIPDKTIGTRRLCGELKTLSLWGCSGITDISPICSCDALVGLIISGCAGITDRSPIASLKSLRWLQP